MPNKISLEDVKSKLPSFVTIYDETYKGVRYKAKFRDIDYNEDFEAYVDSVIKLQYGCPTRGNIKRSKASKGKPRKSISYEEFLPYLPSYLFLFKETYKNLRTKAKFRDIEYNVDFYAYPFNIKRDGKGYCLERKLKEFVDKVQIPVETIQERIDSIYGDGVISIIKSTYVNTNARCDFIMKGRGRIRANVSVVLQGLVMQNRYYKDAWRNSVLEKWGNKCAISGETSRLEAHHICSKNDNPDKKFDIENGIILSRKVHTEFHSLYGKGFNTREQLLEFAKSKGVDLAI